jgi:hypothetical protein
MYRDPSRSTLRGEHGQASVSLVAVVPGLIVAALAAIQFGMAGYALLSAGNASRAAARASYTGADPAEAARAALPAALSGDARVRTPGDRAEVEVRVPRTLPFLPSIPVTASAALGPDEGIPDG